LCFCGDVLNSPLNIPQSVHPLHLEDDGLDAIRVASDETAFVIIEPILFSGG
jgi:hypothetical protein